MPQRHRLRVLAELEHLAEKPCQGRQVAPAGGRDAIVVRVLVGGQHPVGDILLGGPLDLAQGGFPRAVSVDQQLHHQGEVVRQLPAPVARLVGREDRRQVQGIHHIAHEQGEVSLREAVAHRRGQQEQLVGILGLVSFHPATILVAGRLSRVHSMCQGAFFLDRLLWSTW